MLHDKRTNKSFRSDGLRSENNSIPGNLAVAIKKYDFVAVSICLDVRLVPDGESEKSDALDIRLNVANQEPCEVFVPYILNNGQVTFGKEEIHSEAKFVEFV